MTVVPWAGVDPQRRLHRGRRGQYLGLNFTFNNAPTLTHDENSGYKLASNGTGYDIEVLVEQSMEVRVLSSAH